MDDKPVFSSSNNSSSVPPSQPPKVPLTSDPAQSPPLSNTPPASVPPAEPKPSPWEPKEAIQQSGQPGSTLNPTPTPVSADATQASSFADTQSAPQENPFSPPAPPQEVYKPSSGDPVAPPPPPHSSFFSLGKIAKILIGLVGVFLLFLLIFKVIPGFFNGSSGKVIITYWGLWEDSPIMQTVIADFERQNPNIKIDYSKQDIKQYREKLTTRIQNGTGADIFTIHNSWLPMFRTTLAPVSQDAITKDDFLRNFYPVTQKDLVKNGAIYAVPLEIDTLSMYVNSGLLQAAGISVPTNWQDFITASRQLTVKDQSGKIQTSGAALGTFDNITHAPDIISLFLAQNGANLTDLSSTPTQVSDALKFYSSFAKDEGKVWDTTLDPSISSFAKGNLAIYFGYSWDFFAIKAANPNLQFGIVPVPHLPGQNQTIASYWAAGLSIKSRHQKEAFLFMKYLIQKDTEQKLYAAESKTRFFGEPYARVDLAQSLKDNPVIFPFVSQAPQAVSSFFASDTFDNALNSQMNTYLGNAVRSILNDTSPQSAADTLIKGVSQVLTQYGK